MNSFEIMDALGGLPEQYYLRALPHTPNRKASAGITAPRFLTASALAACTVFAVGVTAMLIRGGAEISGEKTGFTKLELYAQKEMRVCSYDEVMELIRTEWAADSSPAPIDTEKYISECFTGKTDAEINTPESKSYLYHMMINSIDYFQTAEGTIRNITAQDRFDEPFDVVFQADLEQHASYVGLTENGEKKRECFLADGTVTVTDPPEKALLHSLRGAEHDLSLSDSERTLLLDDGSLIAVNRPDKAYLDAAGDFCLFPQHFAMTRLHDFDKWKITGTETLLNRTCAVIEGTGLNSTFRIYTDIATGMMLKHEEYDKNRTRTGYSEVTALTLDQEITVRRFDPADYPDYQLEEKSNDDPTVYTDAEMTQALPHNHPDYPVNENGQTYGTTGDANYVEDYPDLIAVIGDSGKQGYIYREDFLGDVPSSLEEAVEIENTIRNGTYVPRSVKVYDADGVTVIDTFTEKLS